MNPDAGTDVLDRDHHGLLSAAYAEFDFTL